MNQQQKLESWDRDPRMNLLLAWSQRIVDAAWGKHLDSAMILINAIQPVVGPRAGALLMKAGMRVQDVKHPGRLVKALSADDYAALRALLPSGWRLINGDPACYQTGRLVRVEAPWPDDLSQKRIPLDSLSHKALTSDRVSFGRWIAGVSEKGSTVTVGFDDATPHWLVVGTTGSGKSTAIAGAISQLAQDPRHRLILLDGKYGDELHKAQHLRNLVGPLVLDAETAKGALGWLVSEMAERYAQKAAGRQIQDKIILIWEEPQEWLADSTIAEMTQRLMRDGRAAGIHLMMSAHHPTVSMFGASETRRLMPGRIALAVEDKAASQVALGFSEPSAHNLAGAGDAILSTRKVPYLRTQIAWVDDRCYSQLRTGAPELAEWPIFDPESVNNSAQGFCVEEVAAGLVADYASVGRTRLRRWVESLTGGMPGGSKSQRLQAFSQNLRRVLQDDLGLLYDDTALDRAVDTLERGS